MRRALVPLAVGVVAGACVLVVGLALDDAGDDGRPARTPAAAAAAASGPAERGRAVFAKLGCGSCHALAAAGSAGQFGPDLDERLRAHTRESLRAIIERPPRDSIMPPDFGDRATSRELDDLVAFLLAR